MWLFPQFALFFVVYNTLHNHVTDDTNIANNKMTMDEYDNNDDKIWRLSEVTGEYLPGDRYGHGAVTLENGKILVIGGKTRHVL